MYIYNQGQDDKNIFQLGKYLYLQSALRRQNTFQLVKFKWGLNKRVIGNKKMFYIWDLDNAESGRKSRNHGLRQFIRDLSSDLFINIKTLTI